MNDLLGRSYAKHGLTGLLSASNAIPHAATISPARFGSGISLSAALLLLIEAAGNTPVRKEDCPSGI